MKINPPKRPLQFLRWFCREEYLEEIEGDLTEVFIKQAETSPRKAKWKFTPVILRSNCVHGSADLLYIAR